MNYKENLNTSHVVINRVELLHLSALLVNLNTSHVVINLILSLCVYGF